MIHGLGMCAHLEIMLDSFYGYVEIIMIILVAHLINERNYKYNSNWCDHSVYKVWFIFCIDRDLQRRCGSVHWALVKHSPAPSQCRGCAWSLLNSFLRGVEVHSVVSFLCNLLVRHLCTHLICLFSSWKLNSKPGRVCLTKTTSLAPP